jgi:hypothetical protein
LTVKIVGLAPEIFTPLVLVAFAASTPTNVIEPLPVVLIVPPASVIPAALAPAVVLVELAVIAILFPPVAAKLTEERNPMPCGPCAVILFVAVMVPAVVKAFATLIP